MLRNTFIAFISGWIIWFWINKPRTGLEQFLQADDSMLVNFQRAFDLLKSGYIAQSYIYIWNAHYIVLSLIFGMIMSALYEFVSAYLMRKRVRKSMSIPASKKQQCESSIEKSMDDK